VSFPLQRVLRISCAGVDQTRGDATSFVDFFAVWAKWFSVHMCLMLMSVVFDIVAFV